MRKMGVPLLVEITGNVLCDQARVGHDEVLELEYMSVVLVRL